MSGNDLTSGGEQPAPAVRLARTAELAYWFAFPVILAYSLFIAMPNAFLIDEFVYLAMVHALVEHGSLAFEYGYGDYGARGLTLQFFIPVDGQLMPQYPSGWAFLAAPFYWAGGIRGLFLLNALATLLSLWLIRRTGAALYNDRVGLTAALLFVWATFAFDYAGAIWPHAVTVACIAGATLATVLGWQRDRTGLFALAGLLIGVGLNMRVDAVLLAPPLGLFILGAAHRPIRGAFALAAGMLPGTVVATAINHAKFGHLSPISYGTAGDAGATSLGYYAGSLPALALLAFGAFALASPAVRRVALRPMVIALGLAAVAAVTLAVPTLQAFALRTLTGAGGLMIDVNILGGGAGALRNDDGDLIIFEWVKKSYVQSMPYMAVLPLLAPRLWRGPDRAAIVLSLLIAVAVLTPFAYSGWWGGRANHMRYLQNLTPALVLLAALAIHTINQAPRRPAYLALLAAAALLVAGALIPFTMGRAPMLILQRDLPNMIASGTALIAIAALLLPPAWRAAAMSVLKGAVWTGIVLAIGSAWVLDLAVHQSFRSQNMTLTRAIRTAPPDAVFNVMYPTWAFERIGEPQSLVTRLLGHEGFYDLDLLATLIAEGRPIYVQHRYVADLMLADGLGTGLEMISDSQDPNFQLFRLVP